MNHPGSEAVSQAPIAAGESSRSLPYAKTFRDFYPYQLAFELAEKVFVATRSFPPEERYALVDQMRRSSRSIGAQLAEAWAKRQYERSFVAKLVDADGEQMETQHWIAVAARCGYLRASQADELTDLCASIGRLIGATLRKAAEFTQPEKAGLREEAALYAADGD